jgi:membrane protease YdiL (CAAX protease family)
MENSLVTPLWALLVLYLAGMATSWCWALTQVFSRQPLMPPSWRRRLPGPRWGLFGMAVLVSTYLIVGQVLPLLYLNSIRRTEPHQSSRAEVIARVDTSDTSVENAKVNADASTAAEDPAEDSANSVPKEGQSKTPSSSPSQEPEATSTVESEAESQAKAEVKPPNASDTGKVGEPTTGQGEEIASATRSDASDKPSIRKPAPSDSPESIVTAMQALSVANLGVILVIPVVLRLALKTRLADLGLSLDNVGRPLAVGAVAALLLIPVVLLIQAAAASIWKPETHPVETMMQQNFSTPVAILAFVSAVVLAPMAEELMFRGILQRWLFKLVGGGRAKPIFKPLAPLGTDLPEESVLEDDDSSIGEEPAPDPDQPAAAVAILATSLLFAAAHFQQWPAPIPIVLLSIGLGMVYYETGSLLAPIILHALFNGFNTLILVLVMATGQEPEDVKSTMPPPAVTLPAVVPDRATTPVLDCTGQVKAQTANQAGFF